MSASAPATPGPLRWLYHLANELPGGADYAPGSLAREGFIHCSFRDEVRESARRYFPSEGSVRVWRVDPRRLGARVELADTPRGPMPHVHGALERDAVRECVGLDALDPQPDLVTGTRVAFVAFPGMTLLDLVSVYDPVSRLRSMGFDPASRCEVVGAVTHADWSADGATLQVARVRPPLAEFDVLVVPGGPGTRALEGDPEVLGWLAAFPPNRLVVSVCTGALVLGAMGRLRGKRATTHASALGRLADFGATAVDARVVDEGQRLTGGGVTCGLEVGLHLVTRLAGAAVAAQVALQMAVRGA